MTNACTSVVVPNRRRMMVTVHSAINPRGGSAGFAPAEEASEAPFTLSSTAVLAWSTFVTIHCSGKRCYPDNSHGQYRNCSSRQGRTRFEQIDLHGARVH